MPMESPSTSRAPIKVAGDHAQPESTEPTMNNAAPSNNERLRPKADDSQPAPSAPTAAPSIIALTMCSMALSVTWKSAWMNCTAPLMTPMSRPNISPANAASTQMMTVAVLACATDCCSGVSMQDSLGFPNGYCTAACVEDAAET